MSSNKTVTGTKTSDKAARAKFGASLCYWHGTKLLTKESAKPESFGGKDTIAIILINEATGEFTFANVYSGQAGRHAVAKWSKVTEASTKKWEKSGYIDSTKDAEMIARVGIVEIESMVSTEVENAASTAA